ncbi:MAG: hypothetical protein GX861_04070 [Tenericutes bacterium]|jgi:hypothetical protein|nr:hypothetical protein [Mycoplasmatota bacterium]
MKKVSQLVHNFKLKYPSTIAWRIDKHSKVIESYLNPDEKVIYAFTGQKTVDSLQIFNTCVVVLTNKRILIGRKRILFGHFLDSITPDMFNDLNIVANIIWGSINIDTIKEVVKISFISKKSLDEIETAITTFMMEEKKKYKIEKEKKESN